MYLLTILSTVMSRPTSSSYSSPRTSTVINYFFLMFYFSPFDFIFIINKHTYNQSTLSIPSFNTISSFISSFWIYIFYEISSFFPLKLSSFESDFFSSPTIFSSNFLRISKNESNTEVGEPPFAL